MIKKSIMTELTYFFSVIPNKIRSVIEKWVRFLVLVAAALPLAATETSVFHWFCMLVASSVFGPWSLMISYSTDGHCFDMSSFPEQKAERFACRDKARLFINYNSKQFSRIYPKVRRSRLLAIIAAGVHLQLQTSYCNILATGGFVRLKKN